MNPPSKLPLRDIHLPPTTAWWPPAPGWWALLGITLFFLVCIFLYVRHLLKPTLKKQALKHLQEIESRFQNTGNTTECLSDLSVLLRRTVLSREVDPKIAGLTGDSWLHLLDQSLETPEFSQGSGRILLKGPYQQQADRSEVQQFIQLCHKWVDLL